VQDFGRRDARSGIPLNGNLGWLGPDWRR